MKRLFVLSSAALFAVSAYACSDDDTKTNPVTGSDSGAGSETSTSTDAGGGTDTGTTTDSSTLTDSAVDAAVPLPCTEAELDAPSANFTGTDAGGQGIGGADISFPTDQAAAQYTNRCVKIKAGQKITFAGAFNNHPLQAFGGDTPSPIPALTNAAQDGGVLEITFPTPGKFGFRCQFHPFIMNGAIKVVP